MSILAGAGTAGGASTTDDPGRAAATSGAVAKVQRATTVGPDPVITAPRAPHLERVFDRPDDLGVAVGDGPLEVVEESAPEEVVVPASAAAISAPGSGPVADRASHQAYASADETPNGSGATQLDDFARTGSTISPRPRT